MKIKKIILLALPFLMSGCSFLGVSVNENNPGGNNPIGDKPNNFEFEEIDGEDGEDPYKEETTEEQDYSTVDDHELDVDVNTSDDDVDVTNDEANSVTDLTVDGISYDSGVFTITKAGTFSFSGSIEGRIYIEAGDDDDIELELKGFTIKNSVNSPIFCKNANELKISAKKSTTNYIYDTRPAETTEDDTQGGGAIYSKCDTKITGKGSLFITGNYNNGIHCTKTLKLQQTVNNDSSLQINSRNIAIKGNDGVKITSGNIVAISTGGEGIKSTDSDVSSKGNQRGTISISGGHIDIYSCQDAIEASYNVEISDGTDEDTGDVTTPVINIFTSNYSTYSGEVVDNSESDLYIRTKNTYSSSYRYALLFKSNDDTTTWVNASYDGYYNSGRSSYYYYKTSKPSNATAFKIYKFATTVTENDANSATEASAEYINLNSYYDTLTFSTSGNTIVAGNWSSYSTSQSSGGGGQPGGPGGPGGQGGMSEGNTNKSDYSSKGIKADNIVNISGGVINIKAYDDGIHANYGEALENGSTSLGDVVISGGKLEIYCADDGIHADRYLTINGGDINITNSYEGIEANYITIAGGSSYVYSTDDGLNAANKAGINPKIDITGGFIDVTVYGGDVDGIDSNGTFAQSGGIVITKGGNSNMSTGLDCDGSATVSGGSFICMGKPEKTPSTSGNVKSSTFSVNYKAGEHTITVNGVSYKTTTKYSYSTIYVYSDTTVQAA